MRRYGGLVLLGPLESGELERIETEGVPPGAGTSSWAPYPGEPPVVGARLNLASGRYAWVVPGNAPGVDGALLPAATSTFDVAGEPWPPPPDRPAPPLQAVIAAAFAVQGGAAVAAIQPLPLPGVAPTAGSLARLVAAGMLALLPPGLTWLAIELVRHPM